MHKKIITKFKMKRKIILLLILFIPLFSFCQEFLWAEQEGSYLIDRWSVTESGLDIKYDSQGNIIVSGYYEGNALFGENNEITLTYNSSFYNLFIAKYNPIGQLIWVKYPTGTGSSKGNGIAIDNEDNIIMTGVFCG